MERGGEGVEGYNKGSKEVGLHKDCLVVRTKKGEGARLKRRGWRRGGEGVDGYNKGSKEVRTPKKIVR